MFTSPEQFASATKTLFDLQMQTFDMLASKTVKGLEQVVALNMATARNTMDQTLAASRDLSQARDARAAFDALSARMAPGATDSAEYRAQLKTIIDEMQGEFRRAADVHVAELVDAHGSGPCAARCGGSSPSVGTKSYPV